MTVAFTGHRTINGLYHPVGEWPHVLVATEQLITKLYHKYGHTDFISGGALGFDQVAALAVINLRGTGMPIKLVMALPFKGFESKWPTSSQKAFAIIIDNADHVNYICEPGYAPWKMYKRNEWMVDNAKTAVALYLPDKLGGTLGCISYIMKQKKPLITIHPLTREVSGIVFNPTLNKYEEVVI